MEHELLVVAGSAPAELERSLIAALEPAVREAVWAAVQPVIAATIGAHVRALVKGASVLPQPSFQPPVLPSTSNAPASAPVAAPPAPEPPVEREVEPEVVDPSPDALVLGLDAADAVPPPAAPPKQTEGATTPGEKKYRMGKGSKDKYNDIAYNEVAGYDWFDLHETWKQIAPMIDYDSERAPENFRRAVRQDTDRFEVSADMRSARKIRREA